MERSWLNRCLDRGIVDVGLVLPMQQQRRKEQQQSAREIDKNKKIKF